MRPDDRTPGVSPTPRPAGAHRPAEAARKGHTSSGARRTAGAPPEPGGFFFFLLVAYLFFEYGKPENPLKIPMLISIVSLAGWLGRRDKKWTPQSTGFMAFLCLMIVGIPFAANNYWAFWEMYGMAVVMLSVCLPLQSLVTSIRRVRIWVNAFVVVSLYVAVWAIFNNGYGPSGARGGQDENYVAAMMGMAIPFAYFSIFAARSPVKKALFGFAILVLWASTVVAGNASRGGFIGICAVLLYCLARSPRKWIALGIAALIALVVLGFAGPGYWEEIMSITDVDEGTADDRRELWAIGLRMLRAHPVFGVGPGGFRWMVGEFQSAEQHEKYGKNLGGTKVAHSLFIELLAEMGSTGALVLTALLWRTWRDLRTVDRGRPGPARTPPDDGDRFRLGHYADAVTGAILACLVNGVFLSLLYFSYLWFLLALAGAIIRLSRAQAAAPPLAEGAR